jgi:hypothetical protein
MDEGRMMLEAEAAAAAAGRVRRKTMDMTRSVFMMLT